VEAISSISALDLQQQHIDSLLLYLAKHGQHVRSLDLFSAFDVLLDELPASLTKLDSLQLTGREGSLELEPAVLTAGFPLTRLELKHCTLLDAYGLEAALTQLTDLQHLSVEVHRQTDLSFSQDVLSHLVQLTALLPAGTYCPPARYSSSGYPQVGLQSLQALTRLADLQLNLGCTLAAISLSGAAQLTRLNLSGQMFDLHALTGKTQLQHLNLRSSRFGASVAQLLSELQHLTQLTHLDLSYSCGYVGETFVYGPTPPPAAYASLTASSRLQHLDFSGNTLPSAAWQYMCPPGRTLPQLRHLDIRYVMEADKSPALPDTSTLVSRCPSLQSLATSLPCSTAQLAPLQQLTGLHTLTVGTWADKDGPEGVQVLCQLTGLQELNHDTCTIEDSRILQLTQLKQLTYLTLRQDGVNYREFRCNPQVS
jgi:Leucine-rich repeat (LRR) protein